MGGGALTAISIRGALTACRQYGLKQEAQLILWV
jgi:hypothetical protein